MTEFLAILAIAVGLAVVAYIKVPKFKLFIDNKFLKNFKDSFNSASEASEVEAGTPLPTPSEKSPVEPVKPVAEAFYDGEGDPPSQEAWAAWRARQPLSTQAYIPKVWTPTPVDNPDFGPRPDKNDPKAFDFLYKEGTKHGTNGSVRYATALKPVTITIPHPKGIKAKLKVSIVESLNTAKDAKFTVEVAGDNVSPNRYEFGWHGGTVNMDITGDTHKVRVTSNKDTECFVWWGWYEVK